MCGRYALFQVEKLAERFSLPSWVSGDVRPRYNIGPSQVEPVIIARHDAPSAELMRWGFVPKWAKDTSAVFRYKTFNARAENVFEKAMWKNAIRYSRCLVPANGFYEWKKEDDGKQPYYIRPKHDELFAFAGLYGTWRDHEGNDWGTYSIITTTPNAEMEAIHDRMPVILQREDEAVWLDPSNDDMHLLAELMRPYPDGKLALDEVSRDVNTVRVDEAHLIAPLNSK